MLSVRKCLTTSSTDTQLSAGSSTSCKENCENDASQTCRTQGPNTTMKTRATSRASSRSERPGTENKQRGPTITYSRLDRQNANPFVRATQGSNRISHANMILGRSPNHLTICSTMSTKLEQIMIGLLHDPHVAEYES